MAAGSNRETPPRVGMDERPVCQVCGEGLFDVDQVYCAACGTPHHRDCWRFAGRCSTFACGCKRSTSKAKALVAQGGDGVLTVDERGAGWTGGKRVPLPVPARPRVYLPAHRDGTELDVSERFTRLDLDTPLEKTLQWGAVALLVASWLFGFPKKSPIQWELLQIIWPLTAALLGLRMLVECTYVLDNDRRQLLYSRSILGFTSTWSVCDFDEVLSIGVAGEERKETEWYYAVVIKLPSRARVQISDFTNSYHRTCGLARRLAEHMGVHYAPSNSCSVGIGSAHGDAQLVPIEVNWRTLPAIGRASVSWVLMFIVSIFLCIIAF